MGLLRSTFTVSSMTMLSRVMGLIRDMVFTRLFGAGIATDAFLVAFKIPNFLRRLFGEGAFSQAFVPVLNEVKTKEGKEAVANLSSNVVGTMAWALFLLTVIVVIAAPLVVMVIAPKYYSDPARFYLTSAMLMVTFPYILFISLTALAGGILNTYGTYWVPAFTPVFLNLSLIGSAYWLSPHMQIPVVAMAWGVFVAGVIQLAFQIPFLARLGVLRWPKWGWKNPGVQKVWRLMLPGIFGSSVMQINLMFDVIIASFLVAGSITWLYVADRMVELPLGVFGVALATVILPNLSQKHAEGDPHNFSRMIDWALRWVLIIGLPAAVGLAVLAIPILSTLFLYGDFSAFDVKMASYSLYAYSFGLLGFILVKVLAPGYFARQDTRTPVRIGIMAMVVNMVFNVIFVFGMIKLGIVGAHAGLALATTVSSFFNATLLYRGLRKDGVYKLQPGWLKLLFQTGLAVFIMGLVLFYFTGDTAEWQGASAGQRALHLAGLIGLGGAVYFITLWLSGWRFASLRRPATH
ncbi:MAG: murein biosynthesis integral membrane protein MurJ [Gammaproteobacteria bacterium]